MSTCAWINLASATKRNRRFASNRVAIEALFVQTKTEVWTRLMETLRGRNSPYNAHYDTSWMVIYICTFPLDTKLKFIYSISNFFLLEYKQYPLYVALTRGECDTALIKTKLGTSIEELKTSPLFFIRYLLLRRRQKILLTSYFSGCWLIGYLFNCVFKQSFAV